MTTYTETQTLTHAMQKSGLLAADETPTPEDLDFATKVFRSRVATLGSRGIQLWNFIQGSVPEAFLDPLAEYLSMFLLAANGGAHPTDDQIIGQERILRELCAAPPTGAVATNDYF